MRVLARNTIDLDRVDLLVLDCDGVLTDGQVLVDPQGMEVKRFSLRDGHGLSLAREAGLEIAILTRVPSAALMARANKLGIDNVVASKDKAAAICDICKRLGVSPARAAFMGDDVFDLPAMEQVGLGIAVADAHPRVLARADMVMRNGGGQGAVREFVEKWLAHQGRSSGSNIKRVTESGIYVIAEIGNNHQGDPAIARELIRTAKICGADAVKSQKRDPRTLLSPEEFNRPYEGRHSFGATYGEHREELELDADVWADMFAYAAEIGIDFFASPWEVNSADLLHDLGCPLFKVPSAVVTDRPLLERIASFQGQ